jgi:tetratricopeptide (TPR) repeat protein
MKEIIIIIFLMLILSRSVFSQVDTMNTNYQQGVKYYNKSDFCKAYYFFNKSLQDFSNLAKAYYYKADILNRMGDDSLAILMLNKAIQINPRYIEAYYFKAYLGFYNMTHFPLSDINTVIELNPRYADAYQLRSAIYVDDGENKLAMDDINKAIEIEPNKAYYYYCRGSIKEGLKDKEGACQDYSTAKKLGFDKLAIKIKEEEYCNKK